MSNLSLNTNFQLELRCKHHDVGTNIKGYISAPIETKSDELITLHSSDLDKVSSWLQITPDVGEVTAPARTLETFPRTLVPN